MPVYDYKCLDCNIVFDVFHKGKENVDDIVCPACGSRNYKKLISAPSVISDSGVSSSSGGSSCCSCSSGSCSTCS